MEIITRDFGSITVDESDVFDFPEGVYGFEEDTRFGLFTRVFDDVPFLYLQSIINPVPCFIVFKPEDYYPGYSPILSKEDLETCGARSVNDLVFLLIANIPESVENLSINIKSPIILNSKTKIGHQIILQNPDYSVRYKPFLIEGKEGA